MFYKSGRYEEASKSLQGEHPSLEYTGAYLQFLGKALYVIKDFHQSNNILQRAEKLISDDLLFTSLGDTYKALEKYSEAEESYQHASFMIPHKIYPQYLLANLYYETGQIREAIRTAEEILNKEIKVESLAATQIKQSMIELILNIKNGEEEANSNELK